MKNSKILACRIAATLSILCIILSFTSCGIGMVTPLFQDADFAKTPITETIYLLPVLDLRVDKTKKFKLDDNAKNRILPMLEKKGYTLLKTVGDKKWVESLVEDDFLHPDSTSLAALGPGNTRYLLLPILNDLKSKITLGSTANAEVTGYIIDKNRGKIVWKHKGVGQAGQGGLLGMAMISIVESEAINNAFSNLAAAIPQNGTSNISTRK